MDDPLPDQDRFIREPEVHRITGLSRTTRWRLERAGKFPKSYKTSDNTSAKLLSQIMTWMAERVNAA
jgi:prophage regulatory protein